MSDQDQSQSFTDDEWEQECQDDEGWGIPGLCSSDVGNPKDSKYIE